MGSVSCKVLRIFSCSRFAKSLIGILDKVNSPKLTLLKVVPSSKVMSKDLNSLPVGVVPKGNETFDKVYELGVRMLPSASCTMSC